MIEVRLTRNAVPTGSPFELPRYGSVNDLHVAFDRGTGDVYIEYTHDGEVVAKRTAPKDANDVGFEFEDERGFKILRSFWTKDGKRLRDSEKDPDEGLARPTMCTWCCRATAKSRAPTGPTTERKSNVETSTSGSSKQMTFTSVTRITSRSTRRKGR